MRVIDKRLLIVTGIGLMVIIILGVVLVLISCSNNASMEAEEGEMFPFDLYEIKSIDMWNCDQHVIVDDVESINEVANAIYDQKPQEIELDVKDGYVFSMCFHKKKGGEIWSSSLSE